MAQIISRSALASAVVATLTFAAFVQPAAAQGGAPREQMVRGFFEIGTMGINIGPLNAALRGAGFPEMGEQFLTLGGAGYGEHGRWFIGGEGHALSSADKATTSGAYEVALNGGYGLFKVGYKFETGPNREVIPTVGFGGGAMRLDIKGRSAPTFGAVLANPARSSRLTAASFVMDVGVTANRRMKIEQRERSRRGGLLIGGSVGYLFAPGSATWKLDEINSVAGAPELKMQGLYARLAIGGWGSGTRE